MRLLVVLVAACLGCLPGAAPGSWDRDAVLVDGPVGEVAGAHERGAPCDPAGGQHVTVCVSGSLFWCGAHTSWTWDLGMHCPCGCDAAGAECEPTTCD